MTSSARFHREGALLLWSDFNLLTTSSSFFCFRPAMPALEQTALLLVTLLVLLSRVASADWVKKAQDAALDAAKTAAEETVREAVVKPFADALWTLRVTVGVALVGIFLILLLQLVILRRVARLERNLKLR